MMLLYILMSGKQDEYNVYICGAQENNKEPFPLFQDIEDVK